MELRENSIGFLIADLSRLMRRAFEERIKGSSLTMAQAKALIKIARNDGIRQVELAGLLEVQPITLARLVDQLEAAGLVKRCADPADRRAYRLSITAAAHPHLAAIEQVIEAIRADVLRDMSKQQIAQLSASLARMHDNLASAARTHCGEHEQ